MDVNPYDARLRMLQQMDGVQLQREAAPDDETAGCPGCPYFWTCPVPHRGEEVKAPAEVLLEDVREELGPRGEFRPHDESDIGWTDTWIEVDDPVEDDADEPDAPDEDAAEGEAGKGEQDETDEPDDPSGREERGARGRRRDRRGRSARWGFLRRRREG